jgi:hypothetical protein
MFGIDKHISFNDRERSYNIDTWSTVVGRFGFAIILRPSMMIFGSLDCSTMSSNMFKKAKLKKDSPGLGGSSWGKRPVAANVFDSGLK